MNPRFRRLRTRLRPRARQSAAGAQTQPPTRAEKAKFWLELMVAAGVVVGFAIGIVTLAAGEIGRLSEDDGQGDGRLDVRQVVVVNGPGVYRSVDDRSTQTAASTPQIDLTVRNMGSDLVLLNEARITIVDSTVVAWCGYGGGGDVPASTPYAIELPVRPIGSERVVRTALHQQVPAGEVDRVLLAFKVRLRGPDEHLYALRVELRTDGGQTINLGRFVLALPSTLSRGGYQLPESDQALAYDSGPFHLLRSWCYRHNLAAVERVIAHRGRRSAEVAALKDVQPAAAWRDYPDPRSAREAIDPLLDAGLDGPWLAVFAAQTTGDESLVRRTRERAAAINERAAEKALNQEGLWASTTSARLAQWLAPSPRRRELLRRAEAQARESRQQLP